jgi:hypothetical protein
MKKEKIILTFISIVIGIIVAIGIFFIYQSTKKINPTELKTITVNNPSPSPSSNLFLTVDSPKDEEVVDQRNIKISGKTLPDAKIVILTADNEEAAVPGKDGSFSTDINLSADENIIEISAIAPNGEIVKVKRVVSYSTESF